MSANHSSSQEDRSPAWTSKVSSPVNQNRSREIIARRGPLSGGARLARTLGERPDGAKTLAPGFKYFGALIVGCQSASGLLFAGRVGTGLSENVLAGPVPWPAKNQT